ncbi:phosphatase PAP2 family protein [Mycobacterium sp. Marseille-P9652]|uniref:phosphatase PAP2 family protein n=1 Tax=Mycobacterium sp. Marseille-P9652 TaxID=2654950 RepID=UPI0012E9403D|nr:phosphatase PAP2 family protein [Mycobacterium sp. Marseille-P9652]
MTRSRLALALIAALAYAAMWVGYSHGWAWLHRADWSMLNAAHRLAVAHPLWVPFWDGLSIALGPVPLRVLGGVATAFAFARREARAALVLLCCAPLSGLVTTAAKALANRPRPPTMLVPAESTSFPSGHALEAMSALLAMVFFLSPMLSRYARRALTAVAALGVVAVGIARVALNVHYPSDVLAGWSLGYLYFLLCLFVFRPPTRAPAAMSRRGDPTGAEALLDP